MDCSELEPVIVAWNQASILLNGHYEVVDGEVDRLKDGVLASSLELIEVVQE